MDDIVPIASKPEINSIKSWIKSWNAEHMKDYHDVSFYLKDVARSHRGELIGVVVLKSTFIIWRCFSRHIWVQRYELGDDIPWCPPCRKAREKLILENVAKQISEHPGSRILSVANDELYLQCANGHKWIAPYKRIQHGHWCYMCSRSVRYRFTLDDLHALAEKRGAKCLLTSIDQYRNSKTPISWICPAGHHCEATIRAIKYNTNWCNVCTV